MFAWVARQERMLKGESIEISKWRRLVGSSVSGRERRITICVCRAFVSGFLSSSRLLR